MISRLDKAVNLGLYANIFLFVFKTIIGVMSNSIALISEAVNSLMDIISSIIIKIGVKISNKKPDHTHQFGHNAAQPLAAIFVAVFAFIVGVEIIKESVDRIISPTEIKINIFVYVVLVLTIITKLALRFYQLKVDKEFNSPALRAAAVDSTNDVLASSLALAGIIFYESGWHFVDGIAGIFVAGFILKSGYDIAKENIDFLMGHAADEELIIKIVNHTMNIEGVQGYNDLRSHYVGNKFHIEIHIEVDKNLSTKVSHDIGKEVQFAIEDLEEIQKVFVHIDPV
ncbi:MAG: cation diffusion facilitator family transporter [Rhodothermaceae bacterium]